MILEQKLRCCLTNVLHILYLLYIHNYWRFISAALFFRRQSSRMMKQYEVNVINMTLRERA